MKIYAIITLSVLLTAGVFAASYTFANPRYFVPTVQTATATTSITYLDANATTTLTLDSYSYAQKSIDDATLLVRHVASSTASVITAKYEYSHDGIDWYDDFVSRPFAVTGATSTVGTNALLFQGNVTSSSTLTAVPFPAPARYARVKFVATTGASGVWAQIVPMREVQ